MSSYRGQSISLSDSDLSLLEQLSQVYQVRYSEVVRILLQEKAQELGMYPSDVSVEGRAGL
jgi:hypothetical protein